MCKYNGISNPYELNAGMILVMPYLNETNTIYTELPKQSVLASDASNIVAKEKTFQKKITDMRAPNEQLEGIDNYLLDTNRNLIFY